MKKRALTLLAACLTGIAGCDKGEKEMALPEEPDYTRAEMWYENPVAQEQKAVDVFYITPTCIWDWENGEGTTYHHMNVTDSSQRAAVDASALLAANLFSAHGNFHCPYYRQITMESWMVSPEETERRYATAYTDIEKAFDHYMTHLNGGRPFILAGHSQGAKTVIELLKHKLTKEQRARMVAAYVFGFPISGRELMEYPQLSTARDSVDTGVIVSFNSVAYPEAASGMFADNVVCINPLNWTTDTAYAPASRNIGSVFFNGTESDTLRQTVGARIDLAIHSLVVDGVNPEDYYIPSIATLFPKGNYHVQEINLYFLNVQKNIGQRINSYFGGK